MLKFGLIILVGSLLLVSCDKMGYKTFTSADELGNVIGDEDPTDWTFDEKWESSVEKLIGSECELSGIGNKSTVIVYPAFPNPTLSTSNFVVSVEEPCLMRIVIVDKYNTVYAKSCRHLDTGNNIMSFNLSAFAVAVGGRYRLYYDFLDAADNVFYKGHGDLVLTQ